MTKLFIFTPVLLQFVVFTYFSATAKSYLERQCENEHPELKQCTLQCEKGKVLKNGCPICECLSSLCQRITCYRDQRCTIVQQQTGSYGRVSDIAVCEPNYIYQPVVTQPPTEAPANQMEYLGSCDFQGRCDSNGQCASPDSVCRKDGWCCKVKKEDYNSDGDSTNVSRCLDTPEIGKCRALGVQYFYNKTTAKCESMIYGGCVTSANSFPTEEQCQKTCEYPCQKPKTLGRCRVSIPRYYFNEDTEACEAFDYGGCAGKGNFFTSPWECETLCKGLRKKPTTRGQGEVKTTSRAPPYEPGNENWYLHERESLTDRIVNSFPNNPGYANKGNRVNSNDGKISFQPRPQPGRGSYYMYGRDFYNPFTTTRPTTSLADRIRSAYNNQQGQVNYNNRGFVPSYQDRRFSGYPQGGSYQNSVDALRRFLTG